MILFDIIIKNFRIIFKKPSTLFIILLFPVILISLIALQFSEQSVKNVRIGIVTNLEDKEIVNNLVPFFW